MVSDKLMVVTLMKEILARSLYLCSYMVGIREGTGCIVEYRLPTGTLATAVYM